MQIVDYSAGSYLINVFWKKTFTQIHFNRTDKELIFLKKDELTFILKENIYQLKKILHNKREDTFYKGFSLTFVLRKNDEVIKFNDLSNLVVYDSTKDNPLVFTKAFYEPDFIQLFTDGSYSEKKQLCSFVVLSKSKQDMYDIAFGVKNVQNSSLIELIAVIEGVKKYEDYTKIRIITDSRYVIKGLTEWIFNWRLNNWYTAQGEKVKNVEYWNEFESVTKGKYIEYQWVKAHSFHFENTVCDRYAAELLKRS